MDPGFRPFGRPRDDQHPIFRSLLQPGDQLPEQAVCSSLEERLVWIALKAQFHAAIVRIVGLSVQAHVHGGEVNVSPCPLNQVRCGKTREW